MNKQQILKSAIALLLWMATIVTLSVVAGTSLNRADLIQIPENSDIVTSVHLKDIKMTAVFVPDGIEIKFEQPKEKLEPFPDPISTQ